MLELAENHFYTDNLFTWSWRYSKKWYKNKSLNNDNKWNQNGANIASKPIASKFETIQTSVSFQGAKKEKTTEPMTVQRGYGVRRRTDSAAPGVPIQEERMSVLHFKGQVIPTRRRGWPSSQTQGPLSLCMLWGFGASAPKPQSSL